MEVFLTISTCAQLRCELTDHEIQYIPLYVLNTLIRFDCRCVEQCNDSCSKEDDIQSAILPTNVRVLLLNLAFSDLSVGLVV